MVASSAPQRAADVQLGIRLELFTVAWMVIEAGVAIGAGVLANSLLLVSFGLDSVIELISGSVLLWRLSVEASGGDLERVVRAERRATWIVAIALTGLCLYVLATAISGLVTGQRPDRSPVGIAVTTAAVVVMPLLAVGKRRVARRIDSEAMRGDSASSMTCGYMAAAVLVGLVLDAVLGWWWAEDVAALVFLIWLIGETREAFDEAHGPSPTE